MGSLLSHGHAPQEALPDGGAHLQTQDSCRMGERCLQDQAMPADLDRLIKDEIYWDGHGDPDKRTNFDLDYLFSQIRKHLRSWWD